MDESCPYNTIAENAWWRNVGPLGDSTQPLSFKIDREMRIASAGSCFAQHIRNALIAEGYNYLITEPEDGRRDRNFGIFPARFGNIYTTPQLLQLFQRSFGLFEPVEDVWQDGDAFFDPFRPHVEPGGFTSVEALRADRAAHLAAVRKMFEQVDLFIFTLGLTEAWRNQCDGAVFQVCPGASVGTFDSKRHEFVNFDVAESTTALFAFVDAMAGVNATAKIVLTVSPVPLVATMSGSNVIQASSYSKSVLRVVAEKARRSYAHVDYFPSYEIVMGSPEEFFAADAKTIVPDGVAGVMRLFFKASGIAPVADVGLEALPPSVDCDEEQALAGLRNALA